MDVSTASAASILERMVAANARDDTMTITLRVKRRDWPERLLRGDDVDFNTAILEKGLADDKTDYERGVESTEARLAAEICSLKIERDNALQGEKEAYERGVKAGVDNIRMLAPGPFGELQVDNTLKNLYPGANVEVVSRSNGNMDIKFTFNGVTIRFEVKNKDYMQQDDILKFRTQAVNLVHDAAILVSLRDKNVRRHGFQYLPGPIPIVVVCGCTSVMLKSIVEHVMSTILEKRAGGALDMSNLKCKLVALMHGPVQKALDRQILLVRQSWDAVVQMQDAILKQVPEAFGIEPGGMVDDRPDGYQLSKKRKR